MPYDHSQTESTVRDFVRATVSRLDEALKASVPELESDTEWKRGDDGNFRPHIVVKRSLHPVLTHDWLRGLPNYPACVECLTRDPVVAPHLDRLVGTRMSASRFDVDTLLMSLLYGMRTGDGSVAFSEEKFRELWRRQWRFLAEREVPYLTVAPLPRLAAPFPVRLNRELELDRLTDEEVARCCRVGVVLPWMPHFPVVGREMVVGLRMRSRVEKVISQGGDLPQIDEADRGSFGRRPVFQESVALEDALTALRLLKAGRLFPTGHMSWIDAPFLDSGMQFRLLGRRLPHGQLELSEEEVGRLAELWHMLEEGATQFAFALRRFNLAFDRDLLDDRIVDLVISAETLLLGDVEEDYRGELRFRFALRAAKFIRYPAYTERDVFTIMRQAYDARSAIVHGGSPRKTALPQDADADLAKFTDVVESLVRIALQTALAMRAESTKLKRPEFWDGLLF